ncbi:MAG: DUF4340 domain-containing protein [Clostridiaceae bacterium]|nr:DUF4340 domain-containing protein [Clostridiaceae bacterium]
MKKAKSIIALVVILLLLCGAYYYVSKHPNKSENNSSTPSTAVTTQKVWKVDSTKVSKIIVTYSDGENIFVKSTADWNIENYNYKLDQTAITEVTDSLINLSGTVVEKNAEDLEKYGLNKPTINVKIVGDGSDKVLLIGDKSSDGSNFYASEKDKKEVYFIATSTVDSLTKKQLAYRDKTITAIDATSLSYIKISQPGSATMEITKNANQSAEETENNYNSWILKGPYSFPLGADDQKISVMSAGIANLKAYDIIEDNPKDLSMYGLDKPSLDLTLKDSKNTLHLLIGKNKDSNNVYFKSSEGNSIYVIGTTLLDAYRVKPFDIVTKFVYLTNIEDVDKIVVSANNSMDTVVLSRTSAKAEKSGDPDVVTTTVKVNDKSIELDKFKTQYEEMIALSVDAENDKKLEDKPEVSITYSLNKGSKKQQTINFVSYNDQLYAVFRDGKANFVIAKDKVNKMISNLKNLK